MESEDGGVWANSLTGKQRNEESNSMTHNDAAFMVWCCHRPVIKLSGLGFGASALKLSRKHRLPLAFDSADKRSLIYLIVDVEIIERVEPWPKSCVTETFSFQRRNLPGFPWR